MTAQIVDFECIPVEFMADLERAAYNAGDTEKAQLIAIVARLTEQNEFLEDRVSELETDIKKYDDFEQYHDFFHACFERLNEHYPCPSITSDYDQSVVFDAIQKGE